MSRLFTLGLPVVVAALLCAAQAGAAPCEDGMASIEYALAIAAGETPPPELPLESDICTDNCTEMCYGLSDPDEWAACIYPCVESCPMAGPPTVPPPTPYEPDCGVMSYECQSGCSDIARDRVREMCIDDCMSRAGC